MDPPFLSPGDDLKQREGGHGALYEYLKEF